MSKKANPTILGLFIVLGLALAVGAVLLFSTGRLFSRQYKFILYFDSAVKGLSAGAPVKLRGVKVGSVVEVLIHRNQATNDYALPVIIQIDEKMLQAKSDKQFRLGNKRWVNQMVTQGLRGKLDAESLVTGVLYIDLEMEPNGRPPHYHQHGQEFIEIPTEKADIQELLSNLAQVDVKGISEKLNDLLSRLDSSLGELNVKQISKGLTNLLASIDRVVGSPDLTNSLSELKNTLTDARSLVKRVDGQVEPLAQGITNTLAKAQSALDELTRSVKSVGGVLSPNAPLQSDLSFVLDQLGRAANAVTELAEFLQRNPNALITGRKTAAPPP
jgi:paraquat-inducible protein B